MRQCAQLYPIFLFTLYVLIRQSISIQAAELGEMNENKLFLKVI